MEDKISTCDKGCCTLHPVTWGRIDDHEENCASYRAEIKGTIDEFGSEANTKNLYNLSNILAKIT